MASQGSHGSLGSHGSHGSHDSKTSSRSWSGEFLDDFSSDELSEHESDEFAESTLSSASSDSPAENVQLQKFSKVKGSTFLGHRKPAPAEKGSILVVDDNQINQMLSTKMLQRYFADVDIANNGQEAIDLLKKDRKTYIAIFLDISMPVMDGIQCAKIIRTIPKYKNVPIVIVSAHLNMIKDSSIITETMAKPVSLGDFENVLDKLKLLDMTEHFKFD